MTVFGKFLAIVVTVLSVVVMVFVAIVYAARTPWVSQYKQLEKNYDVALASEQAYKQEVVAAQRERDERVKAERAHREKLESDLDALQKKYDKQTEDVAAVEKKLSSNSVSTEASQKEVERRQGEFETLRANLKEEREANNRLVQEKQEWRDKAVAAEIQRRSLQDTNARLEQGLQEMTKELVRLRQAGSGGALARSGNKNPPPDNVEGLVKAADPGGLVTVTIGSDAGLAKGQTLEVFRLSPVPNQSKYLGTIRILEVTPTEAVGQPVGRMAAPPKKGDRVASQILGST
jgi:hypothetical protein